MLRLQERGRLARVPHDAQSLCQVTKMLASQTCSVRHLHEWALICLQGLVWMMRMYSEGVCRDYRWIYDCSGPRPANLVAAALAPQEQQLEVSQVLVFVGSMLLGCKHLVCHPGPAQEMWWLLQWACSSSSSGRLAEPCFACGGAAACMLAPPPTPQQLNSSCRRAHATSQLWA